MLPTKVMLDSGSKICAIDASLNDGLAVVLVADVLRLLFSLSWYIKFTVGNRSSLLITFSLK